LAQAQIGQAAHDQALRSSMAAISENPEGEWPHRLASLALSGLGRHQEAAAMARNGVRLAIPGEPYFVASVAPRTSVTSASSEQVESVHCRCRWDATGRRAHQLGVTWALTIWWKNPTSAAEPLPRPQHQLPRIGYMTCATCMRLWLLLEGVPVHVVANRLGHSDPAVTLLVYAHVLRESATGVAEVFAGAIERAAVSKSVSKLAREDDETRGSGL
jgi:hypothetical protein